MECYIATFLFCKEVVRLVNKSGPLFTALYFKQCSSSLQMAYGGVKRPHEFLPVPISLTRRGFPPTASWSRPLPTPGFYLNEKISCNFYPRNEPNNPSFLINCPTLNRLCCNSGTSNTYRINFGPFSVFPFL